MGTQIASLAGSAKNTFNVLKDWKSSKKSEKNYYSQADDKIKQAEFEINKIRLEGNEEKGEAIAKAGASGISVSSFNDALFYNNLKQSRDIYDKEEKAREEAAALRQQGKNERRNRRSNVFSYSVGLLPGFSGF